MSNATPLDEYELADAGGTLVDIGRHPYGLTTMRFSRCVRCGTEYPHATGFRADDVVHWLFNGYHETAGPMCNGKQITTCGCRPVTSN